MNRKEPNLFPSIPPIYQQENRIFDFGIQGGLDLPNISPGDWKLATLESITPLQPFLPNTQIYNQYILPEKTSVPHIQVSYLRTLFPGEGFDNSNGALRKIVSDEHKLSQVENNINALQGNILTCFEMDDSAYLVYPSGPIMNSITLLPINSSTRSKIISTPYSVYASCGSHLENLKGTIRQIEVAHSPAQRGKPLLAFRSDYKCLVAHLSSNGFEWLDSMLMSSRVSSICVNEAREAEVVIMTEDEALCMWAGDDENRVSVLRKPQKTVESNKVTNWMACDYGAHPRTLLLANISEIQLYDMRTPEHQLSILRSRVRARSPLSCFKKHPRHMFHFAYGDQEGIKLIDIRYAKSPVLEWAHHNNEFPRGLVFGETDDQETQFLFGYNYNNADVWHYVYGCDSPEVLPNSNPSQGPLDASLEGNLFFPHPKGLKGLQSFRSCFTTEYKSEPVSPSASAHSSGKGTTLYRGNKMATEAQLSGICVSNSQFCRSMWPLNGRASDRSGSESEDSRERTSITPKNSDLTIFQISQIGDIFYQQLSLNAENTSRDRDFKEFDEEWWDYYSKSIEHREVHPNVCIQNPFVSSIEKEKCNFAGKALDIGGIEQIDVPTNEEISRVQAVTLVSVLRKHKDEIMGFLNSPKTLHELCVFLRDQYSIPYNALVIYSAMSSLVEKDEKLRVSYLGGTKGQDSKLLPYYVIYHTEDLLDQVHSGNNDANLSGNFKDLELFKFTRVNEKRYLYKFDLKYLTDYWGSRLKSRERTETKSVEDYVSGTLLKNDKAEEDIIEVVTVVRASAGVEKEKPTPKSTKKRRLKGF